MLYNFQLSNIYYNSFKEFLSFVAGGVIFKLCWQLATLKKDWSRPKCAALGGSANPGIKNHRTFDYFGQFSHFWNLLVGILLGKVMLYDVISPSTALFLLLYLLAARATV